MSLPWFYEPKQIYSSGSFVWAVLLAMAFSTSSNPSLSVCQEIVCCRLMIAVMAVFLSGLRDNWQKAAVKRDSLYASS